MPPSVVSRNRSLDNPAGTPDAERDRNRRMRARPYRALRTVPSLLVAQTVVVARSQSLLQRWQDAKMLRHDPPHSEDDPAPRDLARHQLLHRRQRRVAIPWYRTRAD